MDSVKRVQNLLIESLRKSNYFEKILAVFLNGSTVVGLDTPRSDIDFTIVVKKKKEISPVLETLKQDLKFIGLEHEVPHFEYKDKRIAVSIYDKETMDFFAEILYK